MDIAYILTLMYSYPTQTKVMLFNATDCRYTVRRKIKKLRLVR